MSWVLRLVGFAGANWQRLAIYGLLATIVVGAAAGWGFTKGLERLYAYQAEQAQQAVAVVVKQGKATERVVNHYIKVKGETRVVTETIEREVVRYVESNPGPCLDAGWRVLHDAAAANYVSQSAGAADDSAGAPSAAEALEAVAWNYGACHRTADRLSALQAWVREQEAVRP